MQRTKKLQKHGIVYLERLSSSGIEPSEVALRLACTYLGEGTRWLPASSVNDAALIRLLRLSPGDSWLKERFMTDTRLYNAAVKLPWGSEGRTETGHVLFMKGSEWRRGQPRHRINTSANAGGRMRARPLLPGPRRGAA